MRGELAYYQARSGLPAGAPLGEHKRAFFAKTSGLPAGASLQDHQLAYYKAATGLTSHDIDLLQATYFASQVAPSGLIDAATPGGVMPVGKSSGYALTFSDEFAAGALSASKWETPYPDTARWNSTVPGGRYTNTNEKQAYQNKNITFAGSEMFFTMKKETPTEGLPTTATLPLTSGLIQGRTALSFQYGYIEAKCKFPVGQNSFPAFWLMTRDDATWPPEIDIVEQFGGSATQVRAGYIQPDGTNTGSYYNVDPSVYHVYGCEWTAGAITFYCDGVQKFQSTTQVTAMFMYPILNLAFDRAADYTTATFPQVMTTDYVRAWKAV